MGRSSGRLQEAQGNLLRRSLAIIVIKVVPSSISLGFGWKKEMSEGESEERWSTGFK